MTRENDRGAEGDVQVVRLEVPARPGYVVLARLALSAVCRLTPLSDEDVADVKLAITEAASTFVGPADEPAGPLRPVPGPDEEGTLRFRFELLETELTVGIECDGETDISEDERELSRAIIAATVDECESHPGAIKLVKRLPAPTVGSPTGR
jgi:hypothetical protein